MKKNNDDDYIFYLLKYDFNLLIKLVFERKQGIELLITIERTN